MNNICHYTEDEHGMWNTGCGQLFHPLTWHDLARQFIWCPYCGSEIDSNTHMSAQDYAEERGDRAYQEMKDNEA